MEDDHHTLTTATAHQAAYSPGGAMRARLREPGDRLMDDQRLTRDAGMTQLEAVMWFDLAHLVMLSTQGLIDPDVAARSLRALIHADPDELAALARPPAENFLAETLLVRHLGLEQGGWVALGRSTHDMNGVAWRLRLRRRVLELIAAVSRLRRRLLDLAVAEARTLMPHYTHRVEGQVATLGHALHAFACLAERDCARLGAAFGTINRSPAGAAAGVGTPIAIDRELVADLLGFDAVADNTLDAIWHDGMHEAACAQTMVAVGLDRIGEALFQWHRQGFVDIGDRWCRSSSLMPGKRSVTAIEEFGQLLSLLVGGRSPVSYPVWYWGDLLDTMERCQWVADVFTEILGSLDIRRDAMRAALDGFWAMAVDVSAAIVDATGISWRAAHQVVMVAIRASEDRGQTTYRLTAADLDEAARQVLHRPLGVAPDVVAAAHEPAARLTRYAATGAIAPDAVTAGVDAARVRLADDDAWLAGKQEQLRDARERLDAHVRRLIGE